MTWAAAPSKRALLACCCSGQVRKLKKRAPHLLTFFYRQMTTDFRTHTLSSHDPMTGALVARTLSGLDY